MREEKIVLLKRKEIYDTKIRSKICDKPSVLFCVLIIFKKVAKMPDFVGFISRLAENIFFLLRYSYTYFLGCLNVQKLSVAGRSSHNSEKWIFVTAKFEGVGKGGLFFKDIDLQ